ncbi:MAG: hypothetical protein DWQ18_09025 [Crenarchaeota archaeon]|nr:MAG: hypothetical protein DWQ17_00760 [Thermoproteota archaeon]RDJ33277.1 MAG: hypothetical protein DWQ18_09025 [Thermoproteota archaeon]RDJ36220.1 MAG: hypothetical protein DWQ19_06295 [Thermoproteota archaeon]RDJ38851.1 MAG: hypothetical protein DWQ13_00760 [Thermoproteota archaeon]
MEILGEKVQLWLDSARFVKPKPAVYVLYDKKLNVLFIGDSENLQNQFTKYLDTNFENNECKQKTHTYQKLFVENPVEKKEQLLNSYKSEYGKLPDCNEV